MLLQVLADHARERGERAFLRHAGHAVTKWFKIPIQFALNNNET